nr:immunoglobulin heavy chain junction region [Macaca mulatta]
CAVGHFGSGLDVL